MVDAVEVVAFGVVEAVAAVVRTVFSVDRNRPVLAAFARAFDLK